ncbi:MAG: putative polymerase sigma factor SigI [Planctomycetota bacterium]|jgi:RNA polymerase sigma-70 factor (ECF subfamily)
MSADGDASAALAGYYQDHQRRVLAAVLGMVGDFDLAEDAVQDAFLAAAAQWPGDGVPANPVSWLVSTARFKAIDAIRRRQTQRDQGPELAARIHALAADRDEVTEREIADDQLRMILTCCHPALDLPVQVALTLREVCGLTTEAIAAAFLVPPATVAQRIVRGKARIRDARIPFAMPAPEEFAARMDAVLAVCYLVFNEGYSPSCGAGHVRPDLSAEAIRLGHLLCDLHPDAETFGLLALMLFHEARREGRTDAAGDLVLLADQDRGRWDRERIAAAQGWLARALAAEPVGSYTIQAAIAGLHATAPSAEATDWGGIVGWYDALMRAAPSPVVELNRAVAIAMRDGPAAAIPVVEALAPELAGFHLYHATRGDLLRRCGRPREAAAAYGTALGLARQDPERRFLTRRLAEMGASG